MRVVALTLDASLGVALSMMDEWEVVGAESIDDAVRLAPTAGVLVIGMGNTDQGLGVAHEIFSRGVTIPSVVVGDEPGKPGAHSPVVNRPFSLDDLRLAVDAAIAGTPQPTEHVAKPPTPAPAPQEPESLEEVEVPSLRIIDLERERLADFEDQAPEAERAPEPVAEAPPPAPPAREQPAPPPQPSPPVERPAAVPAPPPSQRVQAVESQRDESPTRKRRLGRKQARPQPLDDEPPILRKMRSVARAGSDLEDLLGELPMLADLASMTQALLGEVVDRFAPEVASVYVRAPKGFRVVAAHGLSKVEQGMVVPYDHPLFGEMVQTPDAVLISPVDLAQGLVAGIGGARTESLLVAPVEVDGHCVAILVVGRHSFIESDLDSLDQLAQEAAPGIAVAQMLDRVRAAGSA